MSDYIPRDRLFRTIIPPVVLPIIIAAADSTVVATALPAIAREFGEVEHLSWVIIVNLIASTIAAPAYGRLGDMFGRRRMLVTALVIFMSAAMVCAYARSFEWLLAARVAQGLGGGGLMTLAQAMVGQYVPPRDRGSYQGYLSGGIVAGTTAGPVAGGFLTQTLGWHSIFVGYLPLCCVALLLALRLPRDQPTTTRTSFDAVGLFLMAWVVMPFLIMVTEFQHLNLRALPRVGLLGALTAAALVLLIRHQRRCPAPLLPMNLLPRPAFWRANVMGACSGASLAALSTFLPLYFQSVKGASPGQAGMLLIPLTAAVSIGSVLTGWMISRSGRTAIFPAVGLVVTALTLIALAIWSPWLTPFELALVLALGGLCQGTAMLTAQITVQIVSGSQNLGAAAATVQLSRSVGSAFGAAAAGTVLFASLIVMDADTAAFFSEMVRQGPGVLVTLVPEQQTLIQHEIANAFRGVFLTVACFSCIIVAMAVTMPLRKVPTT